MKKTLTAYSDPPFAGYVRQLSMIQHVHSMLHEMDTCTKPDSMYGQTVSGILLPSKPRFSCNVINAVIATQLKSRKGQWSDFIDREEIQRRKKTYIMLVHYW